MLAGRYPAGSGLTFLLLDLRVPDSRSSGLWTLVIRPVATLA